MRKIDIQLSEDEKRNYDFDTEYLIAESAEEVGGLYERGYLPAFLPPARDVRLFYLAPRSLRIDLEKFELSSENRRIERKTEGLDFQTFCICHSGLDPESRKNKIDEGCFQYEPIQVGKFCKDYFDQKFGKGLMSVSRIKRIFHAPQTTHVFEFSVGAIHESPKRVGYVTAYIDDEIFNYTFAFYDNNSGQKNLGMGMMLNCVKWAKEHGKKYIYLGSVKDASGLYKTQFAGWEFFDGGVWSEDKERLKEVITV